MKLCSNLGRADWILPSDAAALQQSWAYGAAIEAMGTKMLRYRAANGALAQIVTRRVGPLSIGLLSRGPIYKTSCDSDTQIDVLQSLRRAMPGKVRALLVTPESRTSGLIPMVTAVSVAQIPLETPKAMRARLHQKWRNSLVRAEGSNLKLSITRNPDVLMDLLKRDATQQRSRRYRNLPPKFVANWVRNDPTGFFVFRAMLGSDPLAEMLFLDHAPGATYHAGWTGGAGRTLNAHQMLLWRAMCHFADIGRRRLDLGVVDTVTNTGLARFKLRAGAQIRQLGDTGFVRRKLAWPHLHTVSKNG